MADQAGRLAGQMSFFRVNGVNQGQEDAMDRAWESEQRAEAASAAPLAPRSSAAAAEKWAEF